MPLTPDPSPQTRGGASRSWDRLLGRIVLVAGLVLTGCTGGSLWTTPGWQTTNVFHENPVLLPVHDHELAWETVVDVVDDYFDIDRETPVQRVGEQLTQGRLDTFPRVGATVLEPWHHDTVGRYQRLESTLQTIRRRALVRVIPADHGYLVDVAVYKELENAVAPEQATAGSATLRYDASLTRVESPVGAQEIHDGWIPKGRDPALEQRIIEHLLARIGETRVW